MEQFKPITGMPIRLYSRRCATCGRPTNNYRCARCWRKLRGKYIEDPDELTADDDTWTCHIPRRSQGYPDDLE
ncbi:MAG: hypothetical protein LBH65_02400 [Desulfovibrio sp.]|jgi:DNA-directed RNA polymerase subunit RPC12/RpoP|nr:hypothetical protein [Desulfovibrio sp.]